MRNSSRQDLAADGDLYGRVAPWVVIVVVMTGVWLARDQVNRQFLLNLEYTRQHTLPAFGLKLPPATLPALAAPAPPAAPPRKDTVYSWVDSQGVTHFEQYEGQGRAAVEVDQGRIGPLERSQ
ncbi:MAG TPA: hypothetical protein VF050_11700 [Moraxellaceae bacterium]